MNTAETAKHIALIKTAKAAGYAVEMRTVRNSRGRFVVLAQMTGPHGFWTARHMGAFFNRPAAAAYGNAIAGAA